MAVYKPLDLFGIPDELNSSGNRVVKKTIRKKNTEPSATDSILKKNTRQNSASSNVQVVNLPGQGFLPGLSRRGRPRLDKPISAVERTAEHRRKRIANGARRVEIILDADVSRALDRLAEHHKEPRSEVIAMLIRKAASRIKA